MSDQERDARVRGMRAVQAESKRPTVPSREERLREALRRVERVLDPSPGMPRPRDAVRDQALMVIRETLTDERSENQLEAMLRRISVHGASGLWTGEDCAIGAIAALDGEQAARAFMAKRDAGGVDR